MSSVSEPLVPTSVLHYTALGPAVSLPPHPSDEELAFDWTLSEQDIRLILTHRGQENLCRFAVQLCVLRKHGRFLTSYAHLSPAILEYLCRQLELPPVSALSGRARDNTESDYQREIARYLGWQPFDAAASTRLHDWVTAQVAQHLYIDDLVDQAEALLRAYRIVLPGPAALARTVNAAHAQAEHLLLHRLAAQLSDATKREIDRLLGAHSAHRRGGRNPGGAPGLLPLCRLSARGAGQTHPDLSRPVCRAPPPPPGGDPPRGHEPRAPPAAQHRRTDL